VRQNTAERGLGLKLEGLIIHKKSQATEAVKVGMNCLFACKDRRLPSLHILGDDKAQGQPDKLVSKHEQI